MIGYLLGLILHITKNPTPTSTQNAQNTAMVNTATTGSAPDSYTDSYIPPKHIKNIALTFDDGPYGSSTERVLTILEQEHVPATFFLIGKRAKEYPELVRRIVADGDVIGNHSFSHSKKLPKMSAKDFTDDLKQAEEAIYTTSGEYPKLYRPPYGALSSTMKKVLKKNGYNTVLWNTDPRDWDKTRASTTIETTVEKDPKPNSIILLHDGRDMHNNYPRENVIEALGPIIENLKSRGYTFVTVDEIVKDKAYFDVIQLDGTSTKTEL